jgi:hypothetical protein
MVHTAEYELSFLTLLPNVILIYRVFLIGKNLGRKNTTYTLLKPLKLEKGWRGVGVGLV